MLDVASVAKRARGENFPVASLALPRELRPHIRALYAYARLVDLLGDELGGGAEDLALSDDVSTALQIVNFLQAVPRDLALGRVSLPAEDRRHFGVTDLDRPNEPLRRLLEFEAGRARGLLASGDPLGRRLGGRTGRAVTAFARGGLAALDALERAR